MYAGLLAAGVAEAPLRTQMPDTLTDTVPRPGDERLMPGMVCLPEEVYTDPHVVACTREALSRYGSGPPVAQPIREQLLADGLAGPVPY